MIAHKNGDEKLKDRECGWGGKRGSEGIAGKNSRYLSPGVTKIVISVPLF
jgi:hypothetical protein